MGVFWSVGLVVAALSAGLAWALLAAIHAACGGV